MWSLPVIWQAGRGQDPPWSQLLARSGTCVALQLTFLLPELCHMAAGRWVGVAGKASSLGPCPAIALWGGMAGRAPAQSGIIWGERCSLGLDWSGHSHVRARVWKVTCVWWLSKSAAASGGNGLQRRAGQAHSLSKYWWMGEGGAGVWPGLVWQRSEGRWAGPAGAAGGKARVFHT